MNIPVPPLTAPLAAGLNTSGRSVMETRKTLWRELSQADKEDYASLMCAFNNPWRIIGADEDYTIAVADILASSLYSDNCKRCFAITNIASSFVLLFQSEFLSEEIIFSHINDPGQSYFSEHYLLALMKSSHLSERIIEAIFQGGDHWVSRKALKLASNAMVTPRIIKGWLSQALGRKGFHLKEELLFATNRIRRAQPEYEGFPDEWVLKVFLGE